MKGKVILAMCALSAFVLLGSRNLVCAQDNMAAEEGVSPDEASENETDQSSVLEDGVYTAEFDTDSNMFHVNEACGGKGTLTVKDGKMTIHVSLVSKSILNLFAGTAEDAQKDGAVILEPTTDSVTYSDGYTDEVYGFDIPVPAIDEEFDVALIGKKGKWYDHKVTVSNPVPAEDSEAESAEGATAEELKLEDGLRSPSEGDQRYIREKMHGDGGRPEESLHALLRHPCAGRRHVPVGDGSGNSRCGRGERRRPEGGRRRGEERSICGRSAEGGPCLSAEFLRSYSGTD